MLQMTLKYFCEMFGVLAVSSQPRYFMETRQSGVYMVSLTVIQKTKMKQVHISGHWYLKSAGVR